ncbi:MAG: NAD(P)-dependent malic enzyme [Thermoplasmata archaeon]
MDDSAEQSEKLGKLSIKYANKYKGKIQTIPKVPIKSLSDFSIWYTPGIAYVSKEIKKDPVKVFSLTGKWNTIAILTDGSRVLGLGNIGPLAATPVMEGKALIFKYLGGVDAIPLPVNAVTTEDILKIGKAIEPAFGGINLEDIESPKCFDVLREMSNSLNIPVWHDDQLGTAAASLAGLINSLRLVEKKLNEVKIVLLGAGAANLATAEMFMKAGVKGGNIILIDSKGVLYSSRNDIDHLMISHPLKYRLALKTNSDQIKGSLDDAIKNADVLISASTPKPGLIKPSHIKSMAKDPIVFAMANPWPEIWPEDAKKAGARIVGTGRSDFPNQINNSLVFPAVFRGILDAKASKIPMEIAIEASYALADYVKDKLSEDYIIPNMTNFDVFPIVAARVAMKAIELGIAREKATYEEFYNMAKERMENGRAQIKLMLDNKMISEMEGDENGS